MTKTKGAQRELCAPIHFDRNDNFEIILILKRILTVR